MSTVVLLHGSWHGGWCWQESARCLRARGHDVFTPSLSGCAEHFHHYPAAVTLDTHVNDVAELLFHEDLKDVVLVGHSYAGLVLQALANRDTTRLSGLYFLDSYVVPPGKSGFDLWSPERVAEAREAIRQGYPFRDPIDASLLGLQDATLVAWVAERLKPHPLGTYETPMSDESEQARALPRLYLQCTEGFTVPIFKPIVSWVKEQGWPMQTLNATHACMFTHALEVAESIHQFASSLNHQPSRNSHVQ